MIEKLMRIGMLYDFYGALLTDKQRSYLEMHYLNDLSLSEIADEAGISRQAVHDILRRAENLLEEYERQLRLVERHQKDLTDMQEALLALQVLPEPIKVLPEIECAKNILQKLINR